MQQNSHENTQIIIDYLTFSIRLSEFLPIRENIEEYNYVYLAERIIKKLFLGGDKVDYQSAPGGRGYKNSMRCQNGIRYYFGGCDHFCIDMSGTGCRFFETLNPGLSWYKYIKFLQTSYPMVNFSRLDVAADTFETLDIKVIQNKVDNQQYISKWRYWYIGRGSKACEIYIGSELSDFYLRIYDKTMERQKRLGAEAEVPQGWVRLEFQMRDAPAGRFISAWQELGEDKIGETYLGIMKNQLTFYSKYDGVHTDRIVVCRWWQQFLGDVERIKMAYQGGLEYNLENLKGYIFKQAGSSIKTYLQLNDGDLTPLIKGISDRPLNDKQKNLLDKHKYLDTPKTALQLQEEWQQRMLENDLSADQLELLNSWRNNDTIK